VEAHKDISAMRESKDEILVWLASPLGDAILSTPALRAIREHFKSSRITFYARSVVRQFLSPCRFNDRWIEQKSSNPFVIAKELKKRKLAQAILLKNSFASALAVFWAGIPLRVGYAREGRGFLLTDKLEPQKLSDGKFKPISMLDYYLAIASRLGAETSNRKLELLVDEQNNKSAQDKLPEVFKGNKPVVILVPGGAYGPSKCWPGERFAQTADWLIDSYNATVVVSVSSHPSEKQIAGEICSSSRHKLINLAERPLNPGELKELFSIAELVISNDTGPRHIATALGRKVVTLFGPNDPAWTETNYENEIQIVGNVFCSPCTKPICKRTEHLCMQAIPVEMVCEAAKELLENKQRKAKVFARQEIIETSKSFFIDADYKTAFSKLGLTFIDAVFSFSAGKDLSKRNLATYRSRLRFEINNPSTTLFLKRYERAPILTQLQNWLWARQQVSCGFFDLEPANLLSAAGIKTPKIVSYGEQWGGLFEERSFIITEKIANAESLERKLPDCFSGPATVSNLTLRRNFIAQLAGFIKKFHQSNYRHRDLYLSHIFYSDDGEFYLIDLARVFKPIVFQQRFRIKDIAQVYYSAPAKHFSNTDRLRFYLNYISHKRLTPKDKDFIHKVVNKARQMARHDKKHGRAAPFAS